MNDRRDTSPKNLDKLFNSMTGYVEQKKQGHKFATGKAANIPDKYCTICGAVFGSAPPEAPFKAYICGMCNGKLAEGQTAIVCGNRYCFIIIKEGSVQAHARGRAVKCTPDEMDALEKEFKDQVKAKENEQG